MERFEIVPIEGVPIRFDGELLGSSVGSYSQIWCTASSSCSGSAVLDDLDAVVELHSLDDLGELLEAA